MGSLRWDHIARLESIKTIHQCGIHKVHIEKISDMFFRCLILTDVTFSTVF